MLKAGDIAPEIDARASDGSRFRLSRQSSRTCTVVYFFPKAFTPGCTKETSFFRDDHVELSLAGASVVGVSTDDLETQCRFAASLRAPFPLIGDADRTISAAYGVLFPVVGLARRVTFIVNPLRAIEAVFEHNVQVSKHRGDVLQYVDRMFRAKRA